MTIEISIKLDTPELTEAVDNFEKMHGKIYSVIPDFVLALVNYTHNILGVPEAFIGEDDRAAKIFELIAENSIPHYLQNEYDNIEDRLHTIEGNDEIWKLIEAIVKAVVAQDDRLIANGAIPIR